MGDSRVFTFLGKYSQLSQGTLDQMCIQGVTTPQGTLDQTCIQGDCCLY